MVEPTHGYLKRSSSAERGAREARLLDELQGPGIVPLQGTSDDGEPVLAGAACSLADVLQERGPIPDEEVRAVGAAAGAALARVHEAGLVHGDVKPANLLLSRDGQLWLADFDTAGPADGRPLERYSPGRMPPGTPARPEADIAALAITLVELSTGALISPAVYWRSVDLRRLGCSPALSAEISLLLGASGSTLETSAVTQMFERGGTGSLPAPAAAARLVDPTPTVEFLPMRPRPSHPPPPPSSAPGPDRWWRRLATSWRQPGHPTPPHSQV